MKRMLWALTALSILAAAVSGCQAGQSAQNNSRAGQSSVVVQQGGSKSSQSAASGSGSGESSVPLYANSDFFAGKTYDLTDPTIAGYDYDMKADRAAFDPKKIQQVVGDNFFATQINDWYENFSSYEGKTVEIEGYYLTNEGDPYTFVGRNGPTCPYCNGGFVSFEFYTDQNLDHLVAETDWIKVQGILRKGNDGTMDFYYIQGINVIKMDKVGKGTVTN